MVSKKQWVLVALAAVYGSTSTGMSGPYEMLGGMTGGVLISLVAISWYNGRDSNSTETNEGEEAIKPDDVPE